MQGFQGRCCINRAGLAPSLKIFLEILTRRQKNRLHYTAKHKESKDAIQDRELA